MAIDCPDTLTAVLGSTTTQYSRTKLLARGDATAVFELQDVASGRPVAAKVTPKSLLQQPAQLQRLQTELEAHQVLKHEHVVKFVGSCHDEKNVYILMEPCSGLSVHDVIKYQGPLNEQQAAVILQQVVSALQYMHQQGVAHQDVRLEHVLFDGNGTIRLCDFGAAVVVGVNGSHQQGAGASVAQKMASDNNQAILQSGISTDTWCLGIMLYAMLKGIEAAKHAALSPGPLVFSKKSNFSREAQSLIQALLSPSTAERPALASLQHHPFLQKAHSSKSWLDGIDLQQIASRKASSPTANTGGPGHTMQQGSKPAAGSNAAAGPAYVSAFWHLPMDGMPVSMDNSIGSGDNLTAMFADADSDDDSQYYTAVNSFAQFTSRDQGSAGLADHHMDLEPSANRVLATAAGGRAMGGWRPQALPTIAESQQMQDQRQRVSAFGKQQPFQPHSPQSKQRRAATLQQMMNDAQNMQAMQAAAPQLATSQTDITRLRSRGSGEINSLTSPTELPGSLSSWKGPLGQPDLSSIRPTAITGMSQSVSAQGRGSNVFAPAEGAPLTFLPMAANSRSASVEAPQASAAPGAAKPPVAAPAAMFSAGLSPAVTPDDSPVGQSARGRAAAVAAGSAGKVPMPPQSPKPLAQLQAVQAAADASVRAASPSVVRPSYSSATVCPSPRTGMLMRQISSVTGTSSSSSTPAPPRSPQVSPPGPATRQATPKTSGLQQQSPAGSAGGAGRTPTAFKSAAADAQQQQPGSGGSNGQDGAIKFRPVYRDISPKLDEAQDQQLSRSNSWQLSGQYAILGPSASQQQLGPSTSTSTRDAGLGTPSISASRNIVAESSRSSLLGRQPPGGMSPAPPMVPPSPAQQHAAEMSARRVSVSSLTSPSVASRLLESGYVPMTGQRGSIMQQYPRPAAEHSGLSSGYNIVSGPMAEFTSASSWAEPASPAARALLGPQSESSSWNVLPIYGGARMAAEPQTEFKDLVTGVASSLALAPARRPKPQQGQSPLGSSLARPISSDQLSSQGLASILHMVTPEQAMDSAAAGKQQQQPASAAAQKPPLHSTAQQQNAEQSGSMNAIYRVITGHPNTPQQPQQQGSNGQQASGLRKMQSIDLNQQQQPLPPKQTAPVARSPSVAMRTVTASPASTPFRLLVPMIGGVCSPVTERPGSGGSGGETQRLTRFGPSSANNSAAAGGGSTPGVTPSSSKGLADPGSGSARNSMPHGKLPLPAFHSIMQYGGLNRTGSGSMMANATTGADELSDEEDTGPAAHQSMPSHLISNLVIPQEHSSMSFGPPSLSRSVSSASYLQRQQSGMFTAPRPPNSHHPGMLLSPKASMGVPCPPSGSHTTPSPSVRARVAHGQHRVASNSSSNNIVGVQHFGSKADTPKGSSLSQVSSPGSTAVAGEHSEGAADQSPPELHSMPMWRWHHAAPPVAASAGTAVSSGRFAVFGCAEPDLLDTGEVFSGQVLGPPMLSLPGIAEAESESACNTPNVDWSTQQQTLQQQQQHQGQQDDLEFDAQPHRSTHSPDELVGTIHDLSPQKRRSATAHASTTGGVSRTTSLASGSPVKGSPARTAANRDQAHAHVPHGHNAALTSGPNWPSPVVVAFAHYKGRLGYLMSSGIVGVVFEDSTHMITRAGDLWACYHTGSKAPAAAAAGAAESAAAAPAGSTGAGPDSSAAVRSSTQRRRCSFDIEQRAGGALKDQNDQMANISEPLESPTMSAPRQGAGSGGSSSSQDVGLNGLVFKLPPAEDAPIGNHVDRDDQINSSSRSNAAGTVPEWLATKARCLQRFVGCLVHHKPYSAHRQLDVTRLPLPMATDVHQMAANAAQQAPLKANALHLRRFVYREGCLLLKLTDGTQQLVFTGDNSVLLLDPSCKMLGSVTRSGVHSSNRLGDHAMTSVGRSTIMHLDMAVAAPSDDKFLAKAAYASKLVKSLQLPPSWVQASSAVPPFMMEVVESP